MGLGAGELAVSSDFGVLSVPGAPDTNIWDDGSVRMDSTCGLDIRSASSRLRTMRFRPPPFFCHKSGVISEVY